MHKQNESRFHLSSSATEAREIIARCTWRREAMTRTPIKQAFDVAFIIIRLRLSLNYEYSAWTEEQKQQTCTVSKKKEAI